MKKLAFFLAPCLLAGACVDSNDDPGGLDPDAGVSMEPDALGDCKLDGLRFDATASGTIIDFVTETPFDQAFDVRYGVWHVSEPVVCFQDGAFAVSGGAFTADALALEGSGLSPPILVLAPAEGTPDLAPLLSDRTLACDDDKNCTVDDFVMPVMSAAIEQSWRENLAAGGMARADTRGLVVFEFLEADGAPAEGVTPRITSLIGGESILRPGLDVRFVDEDRTTLLPAETEATGPSGIAIIAMPQSLGQVIGQRGEAIWEGVGVISVDGALFTESSRPTISGVRPTPKLPPSLFR